MIAVVSTNALWDLYDKYEECRMSGLSTSCLTCTATRHDFLCIRQAHRDPDDLKGLVMRTPAGPITDLVTALGASPVVMAPRIVTKLYRRGISLGMFSNQPVLRISNSKRSLPYFTDSRCIDGAFGLGHEWDKWTLYRLSTRRSSRIRRTGRFSCRRSGFRRRSCPSPSAHSRWGGTWVTPTAEAIAAFQAAADEVSAAWPATITIDGFDAAAYMADAIAIAQGYAE